jgi:hypothetical protein
MQSAEGAGVGVIAGAITESNLFVLVALYLAIFCGLAGILVFVVRLFTAPKTVAPSAWFFVGGCALGLLPAALLWTAESILLGNVARHAGIMRVASTINSLAIVSMIVAPFSILLLLAASVWPLSSQSKRKWGPLVSVVAMELVLIVVAIAFQVRTSWLYQVKEFEHF